MNYFGIKKKINTKDKYIDLKKEKLEKIKKEALIRMYVNKNREEYLQGKNIFF